MWLSPLPTIMATPPACSRQRPGAGCEILVDCVSSDLSMVRERTLVPRPLLKRAAFGILVHKSRRFDSEGTLPPMKKDWILRSRGPRLAPPGRVPSRPARPASCNTLQGGGQVIMQDIAQIALVEPCQGGGRDH